MSIHSSSSADSIAHGMHGAIGGIGQMAVTAWMLSRQDAGRREAEDAAAANGARSSILRSTVHGLREQLADDRAAHREEVLDLKADSDFFRSDAAALRERVSQLEAVVLRLNSDCRTLADALRDTRAA